MKMRRWLTVAGAISVIASGGHAEAQELASGVRAEVAEISPGWTCPEASVRMLERRVRIAFLGQQRPHDVRVGSALKPFVQSQRVSDEDQVEAWHAWSAPVTVELLLPPKRTIPAETVSTEPNGYTNAYVLHSSGTSHVDTSAVFAAIVSGPLLAECRRNFWRIHLTFSPPALPTDLRSRELLKALDDTDAWVRILASRELLLLRVYTRRARMTLRSALADPDEAVRNAAAAVMETQR
jgi:hypothetical protein